MCDYVFNVNDFQFRVFSDALWIKIFYHDVPKGGNFTNEEEALHSLNPYKFSILKDIENYGSLAQYDGKFEFLLEYPNLNLGHLWWRQSTFPTLQHDNTGSTLKKVEGYENISVPTFMTGFGGLAKTTRLVEGHTRTLLDGSIGFDTWNYAIGKYGYQYGNKMPAYGQTLTDLAVLWMRIHSIKIFNPCTCFKHSHHSHIFFLLFLPFSK